MKINSALFVIAAVTVFTTGAAAQKKVIEITTFDQIRKIDKDTAYPSYAHYKLMNDIDASSSKTAAYNPGSIYGGGIFDGQGFAIKGLYIVATTASDAGLGLFKGVFTDSSRVINLSVEIDSIYGGGYYVGGIAGINEGTISNCSVSGSVSGMSWVGGLVGLNKGKIIACSSAGRVSGGSSSGHIGGLVGQNSMEGSGSITDSYATGDVRGNQTVGGLVGDNNKTITNSYATGKVSGTNQVGGLVGNGGNAAITNCYATGNVEGTNTVGGLVGGGGGNYTITNSYATGNVSGTRSVGGLVGEGGSLRRTRWFTRRVRTARLSAATLS